MLLGAADQSSILILILLVFLPQIPCGTCHASADTKQQQPDQRVPVMISKGPKSFHFDNLLVRFNLIYINRRIYITSFWRFPASGFAVRGGF